MADSGRSWRTLVHEIVARQSRTFLLTDILQHADELRAAYPANRFVEAKIRQSLQLLRDQGVLRFLGGGRYERIDAEPIVSPFFDPSLAEGYTNRAQIARVLIETWAEMNLYCLQCSRESLLRLPPNTPVADFRCGACDATYQLKSKEGRFGSVLAGAAYDATMRAIHARAMPSFLLVECDRRRSVVVYADAVHGSLIDASRVIARRPLSPNARRAGWQGCTINIAGLPYVPLVQPAVIDRTVARSTWKETRPLEPPASTPEG